MYIKNIKKMWRQVEVGMKTFPGYIRRGSDEDRKSHMCHPNNKRAWSFLNSFSFVRIMLSTVELIFSHNPVLSSFIVLAFQCAIWDTSTTSSTQAHKYAQDGNVEGLTEVVNKIGNLVNAKDLHEGVRGGFQDIVKVLVEKGADINEKPSAVNGMSALYIAIEENDKDSPIVEFLKGMEHSHSVQTCDLFQVYWTQFLFER